MSIMSVSENIRKIREICVRKKKEKRIYPIYLKNINATLMCYSWRLMLSRGAKRVMSRQYHINTALIIWTRKTQNGRTCVACWFATVLLMSFANKKLPLLSCFPCSKILTTDFRDLTDVNHERKRAYPLNLCHLWSKEKRKGNGWIWCVWDNFFAKLRRLRGVLSKKKGSLAGFIFPKAENYLENTKKAGKIRENWRKV